VLDDDLSQKVFSRYLDFLDPNRIYFYANDIKAFKAYEFDIDNQLSQGNAELGFEIYKVLRERIRERETYAQQLLANGFDFTIDEDFQIDRSESPWPGNQAEMNELWRKRVKNSVLIQTLDDTPAEKIQESLNKRYARQANIVWQTKPEEVFELYLNALMGEVGPHTQYMSRVTKAAKYISMTKSSASVNQKIILKMLQVGD